MSKFRAYNWIPPKDTMINGNEYYRSKVIEATLDNDGHIIMEIDFYFPVGSIFHYIGGCDDYIIKSKDKNDTRNVYKVCRCDCQAASLDDVYNLKTKKWIYRTGFKHKK